MFLRQVWRTWASLLRISKQIFWVIVSSRNVLLTETSPVSISRGWSASLTEMKTNHVVFLFFYFSKIILLRFCTTRLSAPQNILHWTWTFETRVNPTSILLATQTSPSSSSSTSSSPSTSSSTSSSSQRSVSEPAGSVCESLEGGSSRTKTAPGNKMDPREENKEH